MQKYVLLYLQIALLIVLLTCKGCLCCAGTWVRRWSLLCRNVPSAPRTSWTSGCGTWDRHRSQTPSQRTDGPAEGNGEMTFTHVHRNHTSSHRDHPARIIKQSKNPWPWRWLQGWTCQLLIHFMSALWIPVQITTVECQWGKKKKYGSNP